MPRVILLAPVFWSWVLEPIWVLPTLFTLLYPPTWVLFAPAETEPEPTDTTPVPEYAVALELTPILTFEDVVPPLVEVEPLPMTTALPSWEAPHPW